ncbi:MAG: hypothetical protein V1701_11605 [Planctomycetota bacterium]
MGKLICYVRVFVPEHWTATDWAKKQYEESMHLNAVRIREKSLKKVPDQPRYEEKIAEASVKLWKNHLNPDFISKAGLTARGITAKHAKHISAGYEKFKNNRDRVYAAVDGVEAKEFKQRVTDGAERYAKNVEIVLRLTGDKSVFLGPAAVIPFWLTGDSQIDSIIAPATVKRDGKAVDITFPRMKNSFKSALEQILVQGGVIIINDDFNADAIAEENKRNNQLINGFADKTKFAEFTPGGESHCDWGVDEAGMFYLEARVAEA